MAPELALAPVAAPEATEPRSHSGAPAVAAKGARARPAAKGTASGANAPRSPEKAVPASALKKRPEDTVGGGGGDEGGGSGWTRAMFQMKLRAARAQAANASWDSVLSTSGALSAKADALLSMGRAGGKAASFAAAPVDAGGAMAGATGVEGGGLTGFQSFGAGGLGGGGGARNVKPGGGLVSATSLPSLGPGRGASSTQPHDGARLAKGASTRGTGGAGDETGGGWASGLFGSS